MRIHVLAAATLLAASFGLHAATSDPFVVHEWGTFTTVQGADGEQIWWMPPASVDLPDFVYRSQMSGNWSAKAIYHPKDVNALVRMETPVIYFYSQRERTADVRVLFRGGILTEWYPQGTRVESQTVPVTRADSHTRQYLIEWNDVKILARDTRDMTLAGLIRSKAGDGDHYYIARETDANFLRVDSPLTRKGPEYERDLFYRGLGLLPGAADGRHGCRRATSLAHRARGRADRHSVSRVHPPGNDAVSEDRRPHLERDCDGGSECAAVRRTGRRAQARHG